MGMCDKTMGILRHQGRKNVFDKGFESWEKPYLRQDGFHGLLKTVHQMLPIGILQKQSGLPEAFFNPVGIDDCNGTEPQGSRLTEDTPQHNGPGKSQQQINGGPFGRQLTKIKGQFDATAPSFRQAKDRAGPFPSVYYANPDAVSRFAFQDSDNMLRAIIRQDDLIPGRLLEGYQNDIHTPSLLFQVGNSLFPLNANRFLREFENVRLKTLYQLMPRGNSIFIHAGKIPQKCLYFYDYNAIHPIFRENNSMSFLYNILQLTLLFFLWPLLLAIVVLRPKYRKRIPRRLGRGLSNALGGLAPGRKTIWMHALSVGEVSSALPLVRGIKRALDVHLIFSVTTATGTQLAEKMLTPYVDRLIPFPVDFLPSVRYFLSLIRPDLFVLIETDFWPNLLTALESRRVPTLLVNGRISKKSMTSYQRFRFFFRPLFCSFSALCMQTAADRQSMIELGVPEKRIFDLGNLKYGLCLTPEEASEKTSNHQGIRIIAGSTHRGEEKILLLAFKKLQSLQDSLSLVIAPRDITRGKEIQQLAASIGLQAVRRSEGIGPPLPELFILDTIGELAGYYRLGDIAFIGGSLVAEGGHNPIEPAITGIPLLFGPHMEDFPEMADDLLVLGAAVQIHDTDSLIQVLGDLLNDPEARKRMGAAAAVYVLGKQGVIKNHLELIGKFL